MVNGAKTPPPILASEVLREELAPLEPGRKASRVYDVAFAGLYLSIGLALRFGVGLSNVEPRAGALCFAAAAAACVTALVPFPYVWRAIVGGCIGASLVALGLLGVGPLALLRGGSSLWAEMARAIAFAAVPAALLFRAHYRAYGHGRVLLALSLLTALPFAINAVFAIMAGPVLASLGAGLALTAVVCALGALAATPSINVSAWSAQSLVALAALDIGLRDAYLAPPPQAGPLAFALTGVGFLAALMPVALGLFQVLAWIYAPKARLAAANGHGTPDETPVVTD
jgi:hypothetical protein